MKIKGIIFDLDDTLIYTDPVLQYREQRNWHLAIKNLYLTTVYPSIGKMVDRLRETKIKYGIVTSSPRKYAEAVVSFHNLDINILVAYQDTLRHKPDPEPILKAVRIFNLRTRNILSIGDQDIDIMAGKNAGTYTAITGWTCRDSTLLVKPDVIFNDPLEIMGFINNT